MRIRTGIDIVHIPTFTQSLEQGGELSYQRLFLESELQNGKKANHLAGIFAVKESVMKALDIPHENWHMIEIGHEKSGKPFVNVQDDTSTSCDISIAHHGDYAVATATFLYE